MKRIHWKVLQIALILVFALMMVFPAVSTAKDYQLAISQGWLDNDSGQNLKRGYVKGIQDFFGEKTSKDAKFANSSYNTKLQNEQLEAFIKMKPDVLFVTASEAASIAPAIKRAIEAGIPVFSADSLIAGTACTTSVLSYREIKVPKRSAPTAVW